MKTPVFLICRDLYHTTRAMAEWFDDVPDAQVVLVDNASTYPDLVRWLGRCPYPVYRCPGNIGHMAVWVTGVYRDFPGDRYVVSDPDLDLTGVPKDVLGHLAAGFGQAPWVEKVSLRLRADDMPADSVLRDRVLRFGAAAGPAFGPYTLGETDTTLSMFRKDRPVRRHLRALVTGPPYHCRHVPWYFRKGEALPPDFRYYFQHAETPMHWTHELWKRPPSSSPSS